MGALSRNKGKVGERELARLLSELTGYEVRRRVRQHDGDSDLVGIPGWSIEAKRYASVTPALLLRWWHQAVTQAEREGAAPVLLYRADRQEWRACWHAGQHLPDYDVPMGHYYTLDAPPEVWWAMVSTRPARPAQSNRLG